MDGDRERLEEGCGVKGDVIGEFVTPRCWVIYPFLQGSLVMRERLCTAPKSHLLAEIVSAFPADATLATWDTDLEGNTITDIEARDLGSESYHDA